MADIVPKIVEVCIFRRLPSQPEYLLLRRSPKEHLYPGIWQFVTGTIEPGERAPDAATREIAEETGLTPHALWTVPYILSFYHPQRDELSFAPLFAVEVDSSVTPRLSAEHSSFQWCQYEAALQMLVWPGQREGLRILHEFIVSGGETSSLSRIF